MNISSQNFVHRSCLQCNTLNLSNHKLPSKNILNKLKLYVNILLVYEYIIFIKSSIKFCDVVMIAKMLRAIALDIGTMSSSLFCELQFLYITGLIFYCVFYSYCINLLLIIWFLSVLLYVFLCVLFYFSELSWLVFFYCNLFSS